MAKWKNVSTFVVARGFLHHVRNGPTCKDKWIIIYSDYCKVKDYMYTTGVNAYYWALLVQDGKLEKWGGGERISFLGVPWRQHGQLDDDCWHCYQSHIAIYPKKRKKTGIAAP
jgi:hypothetical protein